MPHHIVDLSARSEVFRTQALLSHAWVASPSEILSFIRNPRSELKKLGIRLSSACRIETVLENHDWLCGHTQELMNDGTITVFCRGEGDGKSFYRVALYASKANEKGRDRTLLHAVNEEEKPRRKTSPEARLRVEASRRSMLATSLHWQVHEWLSPFSVSGFKTKSTHEAHRIFEGITEVVTNLVAQNPTMQEAMSEVAALVRRPFNPTYLLLFRSHRQSDKSFHAAFVNVMYAKALWILRTSGWHYDALVADTLKRLDDPGQAINILTEAIRTLDVDFIGHVTVESTIRRREDGFIDGWLAEAEQLFWRHFPAYPERCLEFSGRSRGLELFEESHASKWWFLPALVAFAIGVWPASAGRG